VTKEIRGEIKKFLESNENENTTYQNLWDIERAVLRRKLIAVSANINKNQTNNKTEISLINNLMILNI
jgi:hypothetical protein